MKIRVQDIPEEFGLDLVLNERDEWLMDILKLHLSGKMPSSVAGQIHLDVIEDNVNVTGQLQFPFVSQCASCGEPVNLAEDIPVNVLLVPLYKNRQERDKHEDEEIELTRDDLEFSFYDKGVIDMTAVVNDEIAMHLPYNVYCRPDCQGICPVCLKNRNTETCKCQSIELVTSPWAKLKEVKLPAEKGRQGSKKTQLS